MYILIYKASYKVNHEILFKLLDQNWVIEIRFLPFSANISFTGIAKSWSDSEGVESGVFTNTRSIGGDKGEWGGVGCGVGTGVHTLA